MFYDISEYKTEKKNWGPNKTRLLFFVFFVALDYLKKLPLNFQSDFFFCSFGHPVANLGFVSFWKIQGILKEKIFGGLWSNGTTQTDLLYKMMLVTPTRQEYT